MTNIPQHFTASAVVIASQHILLVHHRRIGAWLPPGGHIEPFEPPHEAAMREALEETGVKVEIICDPYPDTGDLDAHFLPQPLCFHRVKAHEKGQDYYHLDLVYLCKPAPETLDHAGLAPLITSKEVKEARWVPLAELNSWNLAKNVAEAVSLALLKLACK